LSLDTHWLLLVYTEVGDACADLVIIFLYPDVYGTRLCRAFHILRVILNARITDFGQG